MNKVEIDIEVIKSLPHKNTIGLSSSTRDPLRKSVDILNERLDDEND